MRKCRAAGEEGECPVGVVITSYGMCLCVEVCVLMYGGVCLCMDVCAYVWRCVCLCVEVCVCLCVEAGVKWNNM